MLLTLVRKMRGNSKKLEALVAAVINNDSSHVVRVSPGPSALSDVLIRLWSFCGLSGVLDLYLLSFSWLDQSFKEGLRSNSKACSSVDGCYRAHKNVTVGLSLLYKECFQHHLPVEEIATKEEEI